jgi:hypothetical protein
MKKEGQRAEDSQGGRRKGDQERRKELFKEYNHMSQSLFYLQMCKFRKGVGKKNLLLSMQKMKETLQQEPLLDLR